MEGFGRSTYGDAFADVYDEWYADVSPVADTVAFLAARTTGPIIEIGSGTGRLAGPIRAAGIDVVGIDASLAMLGRSRDGWPAVPVTVADMVAVPVRDGAAGAALLAYNTLFNLPSAVLQAGALREAARILRVGGILVVEAFVPGAGTQQRDERVEIVRLDTAAVVLRVSRNDPETRTVSGHHVELRDGEPVRLRPWLVHYCDPDELRDRAAAAGLALVERVGDWRGAPFGDGSPVHVSVFERPRAHR